MSRNHGPIRHSSRTASTRFLPQTFEAVLLAVAIAFYAIQPSFPTLNYIHSSFRVFIQKNIWKRLDFWTGWFSTHNQLATAKADLESMRLESELTQAELRTLSLQVAENDALRALFSLPKRTEYRYIHAEVVTRRTTRTEDRLDVQMGPGPSPAHRVIPPGAPVITAGPDGWAAVGQVIRSSGSMAEVMLLTDLRARIGVTLHDTPALGSALIIGHGMGRMQLDYAQHPQFLHRMAPNLRLVTTVESKFPPGLAVAYVSEDADLSGEVHLNPVAPPGGLRFVVILISDEMQTPKDARP